MLALLPTQGTPTISRPADDRWVAINTIVEERLVTELCPKLSEAGASGIVEYPLNKIIEQVLSGRLTGILPTNAKLAWWGLLAPRLRGRAPRVVVHGVILAERRVLLSVRSNLRGWELPGGNAEPGESGEAALRREILEETSLEIVVERFVGGYPRTGFAPHTARVYRCRPLRGEPRPSSETPLVRWFSLDAVPDTLFLWYRVPLADALAELPEPVTRHEHRGVAAVLAGMRIDLRMRLSKDRAG